MPPSESIYCYRKHTYSAAIMSEDKILKEFLGDDDPAILLLRSFAASYNPDNSNNLGAGCLLPEEVDEQIIQSCKDVLEYCIVDMLNNKTTNRYAFVGKLMQWLHKADFEVEKHHKRAVHMSIIGIAVLMKAMK